ncbi:hypothetical protein NN561_002007 [Cricetulus griseus]
MAGFDSEGCPGTRAGTRWTVCGYRPQTEQSRLLGCGQRRAGQPDVESVGRTLRSVGCLGCRGAAARSAEGACSALGAAVSVGEAVGPAHLCGCWAVSRTTKLRSDP